MAQRCSNANSISGSGPRRPSSVTGHGVRVLSCRSDGFIDSPRCFSVSDASPVVATVAKKSATLE
ncbi:Hypothetical protein SMAX5B_020538 [Scophthalmus maximus]|uniref:Uncharacterized protein n=1 Tax=Scophthalmus maximus TaxID=52904 RepID=A0A2U9CQX4_SCOMX|nr:Hypothetical protein SMAX5B_020538 [Scophthalmus maximus]